MHMTNTEAAAPGFHLRHRLARALEWGDVSITDMAAELDVHRNTISNYLNGHTHPNRATLRVWALRTGVPFGWLLDDDDGGPIADSDGVTGWYGVLWTGAQDCDQIAA